jgi:UDP-2,3-diacylglucosamine pyrophosphatase LpxH
MKTFGGLQIQIASDLHLEFQNRNKVEHIWKLIKPSAPYLALVGDICKFNDPYVLQGLFRGLSEHFEKILYVPGNHEYYTNKCKPKNAMETLVEQARRCADGTNVVILDNTTILLGGVRVVGSTLWSYVPRIHYHYIENYVNDYKMICQNTDDGAKLISAEDTVRLHSKSLEFLRKALLEAYRNSECVLVLTHHAPTFRNTSAPQYEGAIGTLAFATDLSYLFGGHVHTWVFGHTHWCTDQYIRGTRIVSNAKGYPKEETGSGSYKAHRPIVYKSDLVITVPQICLSSPNRSAFSKQCSETF